MKDEQGERAGFRWLALDSSTSSLAIAVLREELLLGESRTVSERNHSIRLVPEVDELLQTLRMKLTDMNGIAAGHGPGSYTGVRIAVTVAKTMAWALGLPLVGVSSLEALALGALRQQAEERADASGVTWLVPLMNARREQVYTGLYAADGESLSCLEQDGIRRMPLWIDALVGRLAAKRELPVRVVFAGEVEPFVEWIASMPSRWPDAPGEVSSIPHSISAYDVGLLAQARYLRGEHDAAHDFHPNYTQMAEAEKKWLAART